MWQKKGWEFMDRDFPKISADRMDKSAKIYSTAQKLIEDEDYNSAINRAYYAVFHMITALLILDKWNFKSHSAVISKFQQLYIKTRIFDKNLSDIIRDLYEYRNDSDYTDFFWASQEEAEAQIQNAKIFIDTLKPYIEKRLDEYIENNYSEKGE